MVSRSDVSLRLHGGMAFNESDHNRDRAGKFSEKLGSAPGISLSHDRNLYTVPLRVSWTERDVIPPRARKPRDVQRQFDTEVTIPVATDEEVPIAIQFEGDQFTNGTYRAHEGRLYARSKVAAEDAEQLFRSYYSETASADADSENGAALEMQNEADKYLVIGDEVWQEADEPVYAVATYGLGHNHGGTGLSIDSLSRYKTSDGSPVGEWVFPIDQREEAIAKALEVAENRGDNQSYDSIKSVEKVELSGDFKPGSTFTQAPRIKYTAPYELWNASEAEVEAAFTDYKKQLLTIPDAVYDVPDGWGGMTKRVDLTKLTERQASDYTDYIKRTEGFR